MVAAHGYSGGIGGRGKRESRQRCQDGDKHKLRSKEDHVGHLKMKQIEVRPVAEMKRWGSVKQMKAKEK